MARTLTELLHCLEDAFVWCWDATAAIHDAVTDRRREFRGWDAEGM